MKTTTIKKVGALSVSAGLAWLALCASYAQPATTTPVDTLNRPPPRVVTRPDEPAPVVQPAPAPRAAPAPAPAPRPAPAPGLQKGSAAFPTCNTSSSSVLVEYQMPTEVLVGQPFDIVYRLSNLTDCTLRDVTWTTDAPENFNASESSPEPTDASGGKAVWNLGEFAPKQSKEVRVRGTARQEGTITGCGTVTFVPVICQTIRVVRADMELVKTMPADVSICDPIPVKLVVRNTGSSQLTNVRVMDDLPEGLAAEGRRNLAFDAGTLRPGEAREFSFNAMASRTGKFTNPARATSAEGLTAEDSKAVTVHQPVLEITCTAPAERFAGRPIEVCYTIKNTGDAPSAGTVVEVALPAGASFRGASPGGAQAAGRVTWDLGVLAPGATKEVCLNAVSENIGTVAFAATAKGACAKPVSTTCSTRISGIPAILLEVIDIEDPIEVGKTETYQIEVTNQGSATDTGVRITCELEDAQEFVSGSGATAVTGQGRSITMAPLASLPAKEKAVWRVVVKALKPANVRFKVTMLSDQLTRPVEETESTNQY